MNIDVFFTHIEVYPYQKDDLPVIEEMYTAVDKYNDRHFACGYMVDNGKLYLPRGTPISKLEKLLKVQARYLSEGDPYDDMRRRHYSIYDARNEVQEESIRFLCGKEHRLALNLATGVGKTFCVASAVTQLGIRTLVVTPNEGLKQQWLNTFSKMFDYRSGELINIAGAQVINGILNEDFRPPDVYVVNHATLRNFMVATNGYTFHQFMKKLRVGIKVYDESHLEFASILLIDHYSNTERNWYLTATFDRSDKTESKCFKQAFNDVIAYGEVQSREVNRKHVIYHVVHVNSRITPAERAKVIGYSGMTDVTYGQYEFFRDRSETVYQTILQILQMTKDVEGKILIFVPLIDATELVAENIRRDFPEKTVASLHSKVTNEEKEVAMKRDIIVSTIKSAGTGKDIKGLRVVINTEAFASKVMITQVIGRLREYAPDKDTYFFDITDISIPVAKYWWNARFKRVPDLVKKIVYLDLDK